MQREKLSLIFQQFEYVVTIIHDLKMGEQCFSTRPAAERLFCTKDVNMDWCRGLKWKKNYYTYLIEYYTVCN